MRVIWTIVGALVGAALLGFVGGYIGLRAGGGYEDSDPSAWTDMVLAGFAIGVVMGGAAGGWTGLRLAAGPADGPGPPT